MSLPVYPEQDALALAVTEEEWQQAKIYVEALMPRPTLVDRGTGPTGIGSVRRARFGRLWVYFWHTYEVKFARIACGQWNADTAVWKFHHAEVAE